MFTGIIRGMGEVKEVKRQKGLGLSAVVSKPANWKVKAGDSISVNGVCSTVKLLDTECLNFEYMPETLAKTNLLQLRKGDLVNLEQSLRLSDRLDGHFVLGHVDTTGEILSIKSEGNSKVFKIRISAKNFTKFLAPKGSVTVEGVAFTIVEVPKAFFTIKIIPYTLAHTNLSKKKKGDMLNIEFDILAKYLEKLCK